MDIEILEIIEVGNEISALVNVDSENVWSVGATLSEAVSEAYNYVTEQLIEPSDAFDAIKKYKTKAERKVADGFDYYNDVLSLITKY